jgi:hypothetical protein
MGFCPSEDLLQKSLPAILLSLVVASVVIPLAGCIAHAPDNGGGGGGTTPLLVTVTSSPASPANITLSTATVPSTVQYTATVTGTSNQAVTWSLAADTTANTVCSATGSALGTMTVTGPSSMTYTAPLPTTPLPVSPCSIVVIATANQDNTTTGQALLNVHVIVTVSPVTDMIGQGANLQFTATVLGSTNQSINWNATCGTCTGTQTGGRFDLLNLGLYYAPGFGAGTTQVVDNITAGAVADPTATPGTATMTVLPSDPLGTITPSTATDAKITCPTFSGDLSDATCYQLKVSCADVADTNAYLKVNTPTGTPAGTVIFGTANGMTTLYDNDPTFIANGVNGGDTIVKGVVDAAYTTVQVSFGGPFDTSASANGWLQGPGGVRRLACRYATVANWVYTNIHNSNTSAPLCATGHREGAGALAYAVSQYGLASKFSLIEHTSGPAMTRLHWGCNVCGSQFVGSDPCTHTQQVNMCYQTSTTVPDITAGTIDAAYQVQGQTTPTLCTNGVNGDPTNYSRFLSDSIEDDPNTSPAFPIPDPPTIVNVVFGTLDTGSAAVPQGYTWWGGVGAAPGATLPPACPANAMQAIPADPGGATQILTDITGMCKLHQ